MSGEAKISVDHSFIRRWAEARGGIPAVIRTEVAGEPAGALRIGFSLRDQEEDAVDPISWNEFFRRFESERLALLYQDTGSGGQVSRFSKIISRGLSA